MRKLIILVVVCIILCCSLLMMLISCGPQEIAENEDTQSTQIYTYLKVYNEAQNKVYLEWTGEDIEYKIIDSHLEAYNYFEDGSFQYTLIWLSPDTIYTSIRKE